jgi:adenine/guanine phosphoribosyltransferase-like PRPP-binding protein
MRRGIRVIYNQTFYRTDALREAADIYLEALPKEVTILVSMGNSGCSIAAAMLARSDRQLYHVCFRKIEEEISMSHSSTSGQTDKLFGSGGLIAIVDDFISGGETCTRILETLEQRHIERGKIRAIIVSFSEILKEETFQTFHEIPIIKVEFPKNVTNDANCGTDEHGLLQQFVTDNQNDTPVSLAQRLQGIKIKGREQ